MARIDPRYIECAVYLYPTEKAAQSGEGMGGSGFFIALQSQAFPGRRHIYVVSNSHVVYDGKNTNSVIRLNTANGKTATINTDRMDWFHCDEADIAVFPLDTDFSAYRHSAVRVEDFINHERLGKIGVGDETFLIGRFINVEGRQQNTPSVRFGNISMMPNPNELVQCKQIGKATEAFLIETHTIAGYSGSPVLVHIDSGTAKLDGPKTTLAVYRGPWLLGVEWAHIPTWEQVVEVDCDKAKETKFKARGSTGMALVAPAWKLLEFLETDEDLVKARLQKEQQWGQQDMRGPVNDVASGEWTRDGILKAALNAPHKPMRKPRTRGAKRRTGVSSK